MDIAGENGRLGMPGTQSVSGSHREGCDVSPDKK